MIKATIDQREYRALMRKLSAKRIRRAERRAMATVKRDMKSEAKKRIRKRKAIKAKAIGRALSARLTGSAGELEARIDVSGKPTRLADYSHRQTKKGVTAKINRGQRSLIRSAFIATVGSHTGVFVRRGARRLPIREVLASRPVDALLHDGEAEAVQQRGRKTFERRFPALLTLELEKA